MRTRNEKQAALNQRVNYPHLDITMSMIHDAMGDYREWSFFRNILGSHPEKEVKLEEMCLEEMRFGEEELYNKVEANMEYFTVFDNTTLKENDLRVTVVKCTAYFVPIFNQIQYRINYLYSLFINAEDKCVFMGKYSKLQRKNDDYPFGHEEYGYKYFGDRHVMYSQYMNVPHAALIQSMEEVAKIVNASSATSYGINEYAEHYISEKKNSYKLLLYIVELGKNPYIGKLMEYPNILNAVLTHRCECNHMDALNLFNLSEQDLEKIEKSKKPESMLKTIQMVRKHREEENEENIDQLFEICETLNIKHVNIDDFYELAKLTHKSYANLAEEISKLKLKQQYTIQDWMQANIKIAEMLD